MKKENRFFTSEFYLTITLLSLGEQLVEINKNGNSGRATFVFKTSGTLDKNVRGFRNGELRIEPRRLFLELRSLKSQLHNNY